MWSTETEHPKKEDDENIDNQNCSKYTVRRETSCLHSATRKILENGSED
jgi:hypothetical protein